MSRHSSTTKKGRRKEIANEMSEARFRIMIGSDGESPAQLNLKLRWNKQHLKGIILSLRIHKWNKNRVVSSISQS
jgi:hypothetical protein